jgi:hypothetical protein
MKADSAARARALRQCTLCATSSPGLRVSTTAAILTINSVLVPLKFLGESQDATLTLTMPTCYSPDGSRAVAADGDETFVCNPNAGSYGSMCCNLGHGDQCTAEGLCYNAAFNPDTWRGWCTDSTWKAPGCVQACTCKPIVTEVHTKTLTIPRAEQQFRSHDSMF